MGVGELRPKLKRALIGIGRLVCAALMLAQVAEIVLGLDEVGIDVEGVVVARRRVVQPACAWRTRPRLPWYLATVGSA